MGNCLASKQLPDTQPLHPISDHEWFMGNDNFDAITYRRLVAHDQDISFQHILKHAWKHELLDQCTPADDRLSGFDNDAVRHLRHYIHMGVPHELLKQVLAKLLLYDDELARNSYNNLIDMVDVPDVLNLPVTLEPLFSRRDLSNNCLSFQGSIACKRLLFIIRLSLSDLQVCPLLPRLVQLLLWYFRECEVYQIVYILAAESAERRKADVLTYHFPLSLGSIRHIVHIAFENIKERVDVACRPGLKRLIKDMLHNMMVGYLSPVLYSVMLCYFLADGVSGLIQLTLAFLKQTLPFITPFLTEDLQLMLEKVKQGVELSYPQLLKAAHKIKITATPSQEPPAKLGKRRHWYLPVFEGGSMLLQTVQAVDELCSVLPEPTLLCVFKSVFVLYSEGYAVKKLMRKLKHMPSQFMFLVETDQAIFGCYFDRPLQALKEVTDSESRVFTLAPSVSMNAHKPGHTLRARASKSQGFSVTTSDK